MTMSAGTKDVSAMQKMHGLRTNVLGFPALFAQSVALISPTMTAVLIIPLAFASAGQGTWLAYAFGTVMLLFVVFCLNQFAKRSSFAGSMYAYTAKGLGPSAGVFSGWTLIWAYYFIAVAGLCGFAVFCAQLLSALGYHGSVHPIVFFAISAAACWLVAYKDIRVSSILTLVFEGASVACITALAFVILFKHGFVVDTQQLKLSGVDVRGMGLMLAMEMNSADLAKKIVAKMLERKILINRTSETVLRFLPPYIIGREHVDAAVSALNEILTEEGASKQKGATEWLAKL